ncbi:MAG: hypothetical protein AB7G37_20075 [Solirubrobacteraceae bacterium]
MGGYESSLDEHVLKVFGARRIGKITPKIAQEWVNRLAARCATVTATRNPRSRPTTVRSAPTVPTRRWR